MILDLIDQNEISTKLEAYAQSHHLSIHLDAEGICNGMCHVYAKYCLEGKREEFFNLLQYISKTPAHELTDKIRQFTIDIFLTCRPELFNDTLSQAKAHKTLYLGHEPLNNALDFAMVLDDESWETVFKEIAPNSDEVILVHGYRHVVAVSKNKTDGKYVIYDPNYRFGPSIVATEKQLISELRKVCLIKKGPLGLRLNLLQHPKKTRPISFDATIIYKRFLTAENINIRSGGHGLSTLDMMTLQSDETIVDNVKWAFELGAQSAMGIEKLLLCAIKLNVSYEIVHYIVLRIIALLNCYDKQPAQKALQAGLITSLSVSIEMALENGREMLFDALYANSDFHSLFGNKCPYALLLLAAAKGGNVSLLTKIISIYHDSHPENNLSVLIDQGSDLVARAIDGGSLACLTQILDELQKNNYILSETQLLNYLSKAIRSNNLLIVEKLIGLMPVARIKSLHIPLTVIEQTTLPILLLLKENGVLFTTNAECLIEQKKHPEMGGLSWILIILEKIKDYLLGRQNIYYKDPLSSNRSASPFNGLARQSIFTSTTIQGCFASSDLNSEQSVKQALFRDHPKPGGI